jgi:hypothetical protein
LVGRDIALHHLSDLDCVGCVPRILSATGDKTVSVGEPIETTNSQLVSRQDDLVVVLMPRMSMTVEEALRQAAWLVAITGEMDRFKQILQAVCNT